MCQQRERVTVDGLGNIDAGKYKGGSGTSGGTFAKTSKAETESKNKIQTLDYLTRKKGKPELLMSAGVDKSEVSCNGTKEKQLIL